MDNAVTFFSENYNQNISIDDYAASRGMSVSWFIRNFKKYTGSTPMQFIVGIRINNAQMLLETTTYSINEISKIVGYDNQLYFQPAFPQAERIFPKRVPKDKKQVLKSTISHWLVSLFFYFAKPLVSLLLMTYQDLPSLLF